MIGRVGRTQMIGIAAILAVFFLVEFALVDVFGTSRVEQADAPNRR